VSTECPRCHWLQGVDLTDGIRLCFNCRNEWRPADVAADELVLGAILGYVTWEDYAIGETAAGRLAPQHPAAGPPAGGDQASPSPVAAGGDPLLGLKVQLVGKRATWAQGEGAGVIYDLDDDGNALVHGDDGIDYTLDPDELDPVEDVPEVIELDAEQAAELGALQKLYAAAALKAGLATLAPEGAPFQWLTPPTGWLPTDPETWLGVELGIAYAVAVLIDHWELDRSMVQELIDAWGGGDETVF